MRSIEIGREQFSSFSIYKFDSCADSTIFGSEETELVNKDKLSAASFDGSIVMLWEENLKTCAYK